MSLPSDEVNKHIIPFNPTGTFPPGTFAPGASAPGCVTVLDPAYPLNAVSQHHIPPSASPTENPLSTGAAPFSNMGHQGGEKQLYDFQPYGSPLPPTVVAQPRSASMPMEDQLASAQYLLSYIAANYGAEAANQRQSLVANGAADPGSSLALGTQNPVVQHVPQRSLTTFPPQAITAHPRQSSMPTGYASFDPQFGGYYPPTASQPFTGVQPQSPSWSTGSSTVGNQSPSPYLPSFYPPSPQSPSTPQSHSTIDVEQIGYAAPQSDSFSSMVNKEEALPPYPGEAVPPLLTQPRHHSKPDGTLSSKDYVLNTNGDALYRFILDNLDAPTFRLHCYGSHVVKDIKVTSEKVKTTETTIVDFNFVIDLSLSMQPGPGQLYVLDDNALAYRGGMEKEAGKPECALRSVHDWARNYSESPKSGKEFRFRKVVSGLDRSTTIDAVNQIINSTGHSTYRNVYFTVGDAAIKVRADSTLMTMLKNPFLKCLLWLVCVWPIIWLHRRFGANGGKWDVCRASYVCDRDPRDPPGTAGAPLGDGDWVKIWERTIRLGVGNRIQRPGAPIYRPTANDSGVILFD